MTTPAVEVPDGRTVVIAGRPVPWAQLRHEDLAPWGGDPFRFRQALVPFENGWRVSVVWGTGTYSDNHDAFYDDSTFTETPARVEVGVLGGPDDCLIGISGGDNVLGYVPGPAVLELLDTVARWSSSTPGPWPAWLDISADIGGEEGDA